MMNPLANIKAYLPHNFTNTNHCQNYKFTANQNKGNSLSWSKSLLSQDNEWIFPIRRDFMFIYLKFKYFV